MKSAKELENMVESLHKEENDWAISLINECSDWMFETKKLKGRIRVPLTKTKKFLDCIQEIEVRKHLNSIGFWVEQKFWRFYLKPLP